MEFTINGTSLVKNCFSFCTHGYKVWLLNDEKFAMLKCTFKYNNIASTHFSNYFKLKRAETGRPFVASMYGHNICLAYSIMFYEMEKS